MHYKCMMLLCTILNVHYDTVMLIQLNSMQCVLMCFVSFSPSQWWDIAPRGFEHLSPLKVQNVFFEQNTKFLIFMGIKKWQLAKN